jgi:hypothetical protein
MKVFEIMDTVNDQKQLLLDENLYLDIQIINLITVGWNRATGNPTKNIININYTITRLH